MQTSSCATALPLPMDEVHFNEHDLDATLEEAKVPTNLPLESQRAVAAYSMVAFALAMAVKDDAQYSNALNGLSGVPGEEEEVNFLHDFGLVLLDEITSEFTSLGQDMSVFLKRAQSIVMLAGSPCH